MEKTARKEVAIAGEIKRVEEAVFQRKKAEGDWQRCAGCRDYFSVAGCRLLSPPGDGGGADVQEKYARDPEAWELGMPIRVGGRYSLRAFCCPHCQRTYYEAEKKGGEELLTMDWVPQEISEGLVESLRLRLDEDRLLADRPDAEYIALPETLIHKFQKGIWRTCRGGCGNKIYYAERRKWFDRDGSYLIWGDGERLLPYLKLRYRPKQVQVNWYCCSPKCEKRYERSQK